MAYQVVDLCRTNSIDTLSHQLDGEYDEENPRHLEREEGVDDRMGLRIVERMCRDDDDLACQVLRCGRENDHGLAVGVALASFNYVDGAPGGICRMRWLRPPNLCTSLVDAGLP